MVLRPGARIRVGCRAGSSDIVFDREPDLEPVHLTLHLDGATVVIEDAGTVSGTYLNGRRIRRQELRPGETAQAAGLTIRIVASKSEELPAVSKPVPVEIPRAVPRMQPVVGCASQTAPVTPPEALPASTAPSVTSRSAIAPLSSGRSGLTISEWPADEPSAFRRAAGEKLFAILDLARDRRIHRAILTHPDKFENLYEGNRALQFTAVAPYLVELDPDSRLFTYLRNTGWGNSWGVYAISMQDFSGVRRHLRRFLMVSLPEGRQAYFRFYDPRVLRSFLPVCDAGQAAEMFAVISAFVAESEDCASAKRFEFAARPASGIAARSWRGK